MRGGASRCRSSTPRLTSSCPPRRSRRSSNGDYLQWAISGDVEIKVTRLAGSNAVISGLFLDPGPSGSTAAFIKQDATTQGTWISTYGAQGDDIEGQTAALPSSATVSFSGASNWIWASSTTDVRALQNPGGSGRSATAWYSSTGFTINLDLTDGQVHDLELYAVDWDNKGRSEQVQIINAGTGAVLSTETLSSFQRRRLPAVGRQRRRGDQGDQAGRAQCRHQRAVPRPFHHRGLVGLHGRNRRPGGYDGARQRDRHRRYSGRRHR